jgi:hypothetical protein
MFNSKWCNKRRHQANGCKFMAPQSNPRKRMITEANINKVDNLANEVS